MRPITTPSLAIAVLAAAVAAACSGDGDDASSGRSAAPSSTAVAGGDGIGDLDSLPLEARTATGGGDPRPPGYWAEWNRCAEDNRSAEAEANGGRAAGWVLVDDVLADPGIGLGDHVVTSCEESVLLLEAATGEEPADVATALAGELLAAELNLHVGAASCPIAEEVVVGAHLVLSSAGFDAVSASPLDAEAGGAAPQLVNLLAQYNSGELCR